MGVFFRHTELFVYVTERISDLNHIYTEGISYGGDAIYETVLQKEENERKLFQNWIDGINKVGGQGSKCQANAMNLIHIASIREDCRILLIVFMKNIPYNRKYE